MKYWVVKDADNRTVGVFRARTAKGAISAWAKDTTIAGAGYRLDPRDYRAVAVARDAKRVLPHEVRHWVIPRVSLSGQNFSIIRVQDYDGLLRTLASITGHTSLARAWRDDEFTAILAEAKPVVCTQSEASSLRRLLFSPRKTKKQARITVVPDLFGKSTTGTTTSRWGLH